MISYTATYSPEDNKLRLYATARLPADVYERVRRAGFIWAARQGLFVAPVWTPEREDLLTELAGEIDDEDTSLVERAEERADRFAEYREKRAQDAESARAAVAEIADGIPLGQPILIGHHSQKRAERDAERIETGMRKAVRMWQTAEYWKDRAAGAVRHAKYKERPAVRARRIKGLEADQRKHERAVAESTLFLAQWRREGLTPEQAKALANRGSGYDLWGKLDKGTVTVAQAAAEALADHEARISRANRWLSHLTNRLTYERAMLAESGGIAADRVKPEKGGACRCWCSPGHGKGWSVIRKVNRVSVSVLDNWGTRGRDFTRTIPFDQLKEVMSKAEVEARRAAGLVAESENGVGFYLLTEPPAVSAQAAPNSGIPQLPPEPPQAAAFEALADALRAGVKIVSAPNLFPTPQEIARRLVELAEIRPSHRVLEPSAGTGAILGKIKPGPEVVAVELVAALAEQLARRFPNVEVHTADFLEIGEDLGEFDRIVMNPPFDHGSDIDHIKHAFALLAPGGRLVAVCANGPRQREELGEVCSQWIDLPPGSFKEQGTTVNTAIVVIDN